MQRRKYIVSLNPACKRNHGIEVQYCLSNPLPRHEVEAESLPELLAHVERIANDYGYGARASVRLANRAERKPAGFDRLTSELYYNLDRQPTVIS